jgi:DNA-binding NtrC family response regulator
MDLRILVIDDDEAYCQRIQASFEAEGWSIACCTNAEDGLELAREEPFDAIVMDMVLQDRNGLAVCRRLVENLAERPVLVVTAFGDMAAAVSAMRAGASDFVTKPVEMAHLRTLIERVVRERCRPEAIKRLAQASFDGRRPVAGILGESRAMARVYDVIRRVAASETTVLLSGESGTGKELVARALHAESGRAQAPFVAINCAAVPSHLLESELFGHVRGAFTDAHSDRAGLFQQAKQGTLFLDEIAELPREMQPKLLRALQERQVRPVGGNSLVDVQARIIAASNRDLENEVAAGRFREDLYYRLNVVQVCIPPLHSRGNDVLLLAEHFVRRFAERMGKAVTGLSPEASQKLLQFDWPGNVRQLENTMERAVALTQGGQITLADLPDRIRQHDSRSRLPEVVAEDIATLDQQERRHIDHVLRMVNGNKTEAARLLGVNRRTLYRRLTRDSTVSSEASELPR